jgi:hypothetical protein
VAHIVGTVLPVSPQVVIGPDSGLPPTSPNTWAFDLDNGDGSYSVGGVNDAKVGRPGVVLARPVRCLHKAATRPGARPRKR